MGERQSTVVAVTVCMVAAALSVVLPLRSDVLGMRCLLRVPGKAPLLRASVFMRCPTTLDGVLCLLRYTLLANLAGGAQLSSRAIVVLMRCPYAILQGVPCSTCLTNTLTQVSGEAILRALSAAEYNAPDAAASQPVLDGFTTAIRQAFSTCLLLCSPRHQNAQLLTSTSTSSLNGPSPGLVHPNALHAGDGAESLLPSAPRVRQVSMCQWCASSSFATNSPLCETVVRRVGRLCGVVGLDRLCEDLIAALAAAVSAHTPASPGSPGEQKQVCANQFFTPSTCISHVVGYNYFHDPHHHCPPVFEAPCGQAYEQTCAVHLFSAMSVTLTLAFACLATGCCACRPRISGVGPLGRAHRLRLGDHSAHAVRH